MTELMTRAQAVEMATRFEKALALRGRTGQLVVWSSTFARAYVYCGEWVADCPQEGCSNTEYIVDKLDRERGVAGTRGERKDVFFCSYCRSLASSIQWPADAEEILEVLERRPLAYNRNWYPEGHIVALRWDLPDGQTVAELRAENAEHGVD